MLLTHGSLHIILVSHPSISDAMSRRTVAAGAMDEAFKSKGIFMLHAGSSDRRCERCVEILVFLRHQKINQEEFPLVSSGSTIYKTEIFTNYLLFTMI